MENNDDVVIEMDDGDLSIGFIDQSQIVTAVIICCDLIITSLCLKGQCTQGAQTSIIHYAM